MDNLDKTQTLAILDKRLKVLPRGMNNLCAIIGQYLNKQHSTEDFIEYYLQMIEGFSARLKQHNHKEELKKNYLAEFKMFKSVLNACKDYSSKKTDENTFNTLIQLEVEKYAKTPIERKSYFT